MADSSQPNLFNLSSESSGSVECLGLTFENDEARRAYFLEKLKEKLQDPEFRKIEGFPIGEDEDILALSDPPYYTACPNPFMEDFIQHYGKPYDPGTDDYQREPYAADVSEGKTDGIYTAHSYHTKVPHKAAARYILHYTNPGDVVLDGFAGSGMTGVAAQMCAKPDPDFKYSVDTERQAADLPPVEWGARRVVLNDLSPAATFISANYNLPLEKLRERALLKEFEEYRQASQKQLKVIRLEAVRVGFKQAWQERDYMTVINVARKIPENILQEDPKLLMWYDQSLTRAGEE